MSDEIAPVDEWKHALQYINSDVYAELEYVRAWADSVEFDYDEGPNGIGFTKNGATYWYLIDDVGWDSDDPRGEIISELISQLESTRRERDEATRITAKANAEREAALNAREEDCRRLSMVHIKRAQLEGLKAAHARLIAELSTACAEAEQLRSELANARWADETRRKACDALVAERDAARAESAQLRSELAQRDRDWDALVKLIATTVGTEEDRDCAENDEMAEFDPWHALRTRAAESAQLRAERDSFMQQAADMAARFAEVRAERDAAVQSTQMRIACFVSDSLDWDRSNDAALYGIVDSIESGAWKDGVKR